MESCITCDLQVNLALCVTCVLQVNLESRFIGEPGTCISCVLSVNLESCVSRLNMELCVNVFYG